MRPTPSSANPEPGSKTARPRLEPRVLEGLRRGEPAARSATYDAFGASVYRLCRSMLRQDSDAEDATQDIFVKVFERVDGFRGDAKFSTWLYRLSVNHCLNRIERDGRRRAEELCEEEPAPSALPCEEVQRGEAWKEVDGMLERLAPDHRAILVLRELEDLSYAEIAKALEIPTGTVMSRLSRARQKLADILSPPSGASPDPGRPLHRTRPLPIPRHAS